MKKMIFGAMAFGLVLVSCEKEEMINEANSENSVENTETINTRLSDLKIWVSEYNEEDPNAGFCTATGGNCQSEYGFSVELQSVLDIAFSAVSDGKPEVISGVFAEHYDVLVERIDPKYVDGTIKGDFIVKNSGELSVESSAYLQFYDLDDKLVHVYEFIQE